MILLLPAAERTETDLWSTVLGSLVDQGKNPHLHTKNFIERLAGENMYTNGILSGITVSLAHVVWLPREERN